MSLFLMIDIGAGTMDLLCYDSRSGEHFKAVAPAPVRVLAQEIAATSGPLLVRGVEMGGGPVTEVLRRRAAESEVVITPAAAATLHHDLDKVRAWGFQLADEARIDQLAGDPAYARITLQDVQPERIAYIIKGLGLPMAFDSVALCAQDHGVAPSGVSHLDFRHNLFQVILARTPSPPSLLFRSDEVPASFNRLRSIARTARLLNAGEIYIMDSGMAAMTGAAQDQQARGKEAIIILDVATSHTVAAVLQGDQVAAFIEYHTRDITRERLEELLVDMADGRIRHDRILAEGGHGAFLRHTVGFENVQAIIATGPKRGLLKDSRLPICWGAPWGDNMMTGTVGLLEALRRRRQMAPIAYL